MVWWIAGRNRDRGTRAAATDIARGVSLSSRAHRYGDSDFDFNDPDYRRRPDDPWEAYGQPKTAGSLLAVALTARGRRPST